LNKKVEEMIKWEIWELIQKKKNRK
jgi:hypothetical protein